MNKVLRYLFLSCISIIVLYSCKHETESPVDVGYGYYPSVIGHWIIYDVDSTNYDEFLDTVKNYKFQLKEIIESTYSDNQNRPTQRLERYTRLNDTINWYLSDVWASNLTASTAEKVEENIRFIKLIFPIKSGRTWNGNALNNIGSQDYEYDNVFEPYTVNGVTFDSTVTVIQNIEGPNYVFEKYMIEVFAKNVGLIYKKYKDVTFDPAHAGVIKSGVDYTYKIKSFGN